MLKSLFNMGKPIYDPTLGDSLARRILEDAKAEKVDKVINQIAPIRTGQWDKRNFYVDLAGEHITNQKVLGTLPDSSIGNLIRGSMAIHLAWAARGGGQAETVTKEGWDIFFRFLNIAGNSLLRAGEQDMEDPTPFALLQTVAMGMQLDRKTTESWFHEAVKRDKYNQGAHYGHLFLLCKKWGGSHEEMFEFARTTSSNTPDNMTLHTILYIAFQEYYLYYVAFERDEVKANSFIHEKRTREESIRTYQKSLLNRKKIDQVSDYWPHNVTAWWFMMLNIPEVVRRETQKIGPYFTKYPWLIFYRDPAAGYHQATKI